MRTIRCPHCASGPEDIRLHGVVEIGFEFLYTDDTWSSSNLATDPEAIRVEATCGSCGNHWRLRRVRAVDEIDPSATLPNIFAPPGDPGPQHPISGDDMADRYIPTHLYINNDRFQDFDGIEATAFHVVTSKSPEKWDGKLTTRVETAGISYIVCSGVLVREGSDVFFRFSPQGSMIQRSFLASNICLDPAPHFQDRIMKSDLHSGLGTWKIPAQWVGSELSDLDPEEMVEVLEKFSDRYRSDLLESMVRRVDSELLRDIDIWNTVAGTLAELA